MPKIIVLGAGVCGLTAGMLLAGDGHEVTVVEAIGLPEPTVVDGIGQEPMDGTSFAYTFADASAAERHTTQYFEFGGARAIYRDGWWACTRLDKAPWDLSPERHDAPHRAGRLLQLRRHGHRPRQRPGRRPRV
jgi:arylsulfatase A-like enzyme